VIAALLVVLLAAAAGTPDAQDGTLSPAGVPESSGFSPSANASEALQRQFIDLLRTYPQRPVAESHRLVEALVDAGPFAERDRALYWLGSARLSAKDLPGARGSFARLRREHPGSAWVERATLGEAEACGLERDYACALRWLEEAKVARDPAVRELGRLSTAQVKDLVSRRRIAVGGLVFAAAVLIFLLASFWRRRQRAILSTRIGDPLRHAVAILPLPTEVTVLLPVLGMLALLSVRQDPAPRAAVLQICAAGALLVTASGLRLRAAAPGAAQRVLQIAATVLALAACVYAAIWRADLYAMVLETIRAGPE